MDLRPYQEQAIERIRDAIRAGHRRILAVAPTGSGKTVTFAHILKETVRRGRTGLVLVHREELLDQACEKLRSLGVSTGVIKASRRAEPCWPVQVASVQSLIRRPVPPTDVAIIDEAHRTLAGSYRQILDRLPDAKVLGFTATPIRADGRGLGDVYTSLVEIATPSELIAQGVLVPPRVYAPSAPDLAGVRTTAGDYNQKDLVLRVDTPRLIGSVAEHWGRIVKGRLAVAFAASIDHSKHLAEALRGAGARAVHVDADTDPDVRKTYIDLLARGELDVITNVGLFCEGLDLPSLGAVIVARPTQSTGLWIQMCGRGARSHPGKTEYLLVDHAANVLRHGFPDEDRAHSLDATPRREAAPVKTCSRCYLVVSAGAHVCPGCGLEFGGAATAPADRTPEVVEGELVELRERPPIPVAPKILQRQKDYVRWRAEAWLKGWMPGYAARKYLEKYGVWPVRLITAAWDQNRAAELAAELDIRDRQAYVGRRAEA